MGDWVNVYSSPTYNNSNIANGATEVVRLTARDKRELRRNNMSFNSWMIQETAGASGLTLVFDAGQSHARTVAIRSNDTIVVEPEEGESYAEVTITNDSGAQYNADSMIVNKSMKIPLDAARIRKLV